MYIITLLLLLLSTSITTSLPLSPFLQERDYSSTATKINTIISDLDALKAAVTAFTGTPAGALPVGAAAGKLDNDLNLTTADIGTSTYTTSQSSALRTLVVPLGPAHTSGLAALAAKAPLFAAAGATTQVANQLLQLWFDNDDFWTALVGKLAPGDQGPVDAAGNQTRLAYENALLAF
ncbi:hypothetical protein L873DRAFT_207977 [Choiromyces venosus 120613-1]|uniref:Hydrophobic surface binding protein A n=1 Tax=Choiromyces venosus 120613-1 TaxID=1336337 RepID=A0A3N4J1J6_9PEZI|nr:hypothetical protein L873DRAFT_207977 [Choiromyces venosus 120613-1]